MRLSELDLGNFIRGRKELLKEPLEKTRFTLELDRAEYAQAMAELGD